MSSNLKVSRYGLQGCCMDYCVQSSITEVAALPLRTRKTVGTVSDGRILYGGCQGVKS